MPGNASKQECPIVLRGEGIRGIAVEQIGEEQEGIALEIVRFQKGETLRTGVPSVDPRAEVVVRLERAVREVPPA